MREFLQIMAAALVSAALGALFGWVIGRYAPEFFEVVAPMREIRQPQRVGAALGAINGLMIGAAAMGFALLIGAIRGRFNRVGSAADDPQPRR
jgi:membrane protein YqaA with SNARE-associated domain